MVILSPVPEVPQEVAFSEQVVTSVFVTWRPPPGQVEGYKVRHMHYCICPVPSNNHRRRDRNQRLLHLSNFQTDVCNDAGPCHLSYTHITQSDFFSGQMRPLTTSGSALTFWLLSNRCSDSVTDSLKMHNLCRVPASKNDQAHYMHALHQHTLTDINERHCWIK